MLDIAAGHGLFGINIARHNPQAEIVALDWPQVLEVAKENARKVRRRIPLFHRSPEALSKLSSAKAYDLVLLTNFLHHFDPADLRDDSCAKSARRFSPAGRAVTLEFVPNDDRVTPPEAATFSMIMLGSTPSRRCLHFRGIRAHVPAMPASAAANTTVNPRAGVGDHFLPLAQGTACCKTPRRQALLSNVERRMFYLAFSGYNDCDHGTQP